MQVRSTDKSLVRMIVAHFEIDEYVNKRIENYDKMLKSGILDCVKEKPELCYDCISRQAVIDTIETDCSWDMFNEWGSRTPMGERIVEAIKRVPSSEPERKVGKWEYLQYDGNPKIGNWHCSECKRIVFLLHSQKQNEKPLYDFCPWCGAKMEVNE